MKLIITYREGVLINTTRLFQKHFIRTCMWPSWGTLEKRFQPYGVRHACNPGTWSADAGASRDLDGQLLRGHPGLHETLSQNK